MFDDSFDYKYCPILSISLYELTALDKLPDKDKALILPVFPIKSWVSAKKLSSALDKVSTAIGESRKWIVDIDYNDLLSRPIEKYRPVHHDIKKFTKPIGGYKNWCDFIKEHKQCIPCIQLTDLNEFDTQLRVLSSLKRGVVVILRQSDLESKVHEIILPKLRDTTNLLIILDFGKITRQEIYYKEQILMYLQAIRAVLPKANMSLSSTSFPDSFGGCHRGTNSIYERALTLSLKLTMTKPKGSAMQLLTM